MGRCLFDTALDLIDRLEIERIALDLLFHIVTGTHNRRVIPASELSSDVIICRIKQFAAQIHRNLSG